ncbi:MAG TPA: HdeD family acid-resistance protein [Gemmatales bacterium]|nr:HdeD family acid-resistance protein [Gemmatales bacterium]
MSALPIVAMQLALTFTERWWVFLVRGLLALLFGILCFVQPGLSLATLVMMFGIFALADGIVGVFIAVVGRKEIEDWWVLLLWGLIGIASGVLTFTAPDITALVLLFYIAIWAMVSGVLQIALAVRLRKEIEGELFLILAGALSIVFGIVLIARPGEGAVAVAWLIGTFAIVYGITMTSLSLRLRSFRSRLKERLGI